MTQTPLNNIRASNCLHIEKRGCFPEKVFSSFSSQYDFERVFCDNMKFVRYPKVIITHKPTVVHRFHLSVLWSRVRFVAKFRVLVRYSTRICIDIFYFPSLFYTGPGEIFNKFFAITSGAKKKKNTRTIVFTLDFDNIAYTVQYTVIYIYIYTYTFQRLLKD